MDCKNPNKQHQHVHERDSSKTLHTFRTGSFFHKKRISATVHNTQCSSRDDKRKRIHPSLSHSYEVLGHIHLQRISHMDDTLISDTERAPSSHCNLRTSRNVDVHGTREGSTHTTMKTKMATLISDTVPPKQKDLDVGNVSVHERPDRSVRPLPQV